MNHESRTARAVTNPTLRRGTLAAAIGAGLVALHAAGPTLPLGTGMARPGHWATWVASVGPAASLVAAVRGVALVVGAYLLVVTVVDLAATLTCSPALAWCARRITLPFARKLITGITGAGLAISLSVGVAAPTLASAAPRSPAPPTTAVRSSPPSRPAPNHTMRRPDPAYASGLDQPDPTPTSTIASDPPDSLAGSGSVPAADSPPTMRRLETEPPAPPAVAPPAAVPSPPTPGGAVWTIVPGDHLWRVASRTLAARWGRSATDDETARYLHDLIGLNQAVLVVADDPDLVLPGQVFALPPVPAA